VNRISHYVIPSIIFSFVLYFSPQLLQVIKKSGLSTSAAANFRDRRRKKVAIGMEDTVGLLLGLTGAVKSGTVASGDYGGGAVEDFGNQEDLEKTVMQIFSRLDVDGDGSVSWWEWKAVLSAALCGRNQAEKYLNPMDAVVLGLQAAADALHMRRKMVEWQGIDSGSAANDANRMVFVDPNKAVAGNTNGNGIEAYEPSGVPSKSSSRLQYEVQSLRQTNSLLSQRLEKALTDSQNVLDGALTASTIAPHYGDTSRPPRPQDSEMFGNLLRRQMEAEFEAEKASKSYLDEQQRRADLEAQLLQLRGLTDTLTGAKSEAQKAMETKRQQLMDEVAAHREALRVISERRQARIRAIAVVGMYLKHRFLPAVRQKCFKKNKDRLSHVLNSAFIRKKYLKLLQKRKEAATVIQRIARGRADRRNLKAKQAAAVDVQVSSYHTEKLLLLECSLSYGF
jgi:hypothetical protein